MLKRLAFVLLVVGLVQGCSYCNTISSEVTPVGNHYRPSLWIDVFFGPYHGDEKYEQIAYIRVQGARHSRMPELMTQLKNKAREVGADAVIQVEVSDTERKEGLLALDLLEVAVNISDAGNRASEPKSEYDGRYQSLVLSGVAIKYLSDASQAETHP